MVIMVIIILTVSLIGFIIIVFVIITRQFLISCTSLSFKLAERYLKIIGKLVTRRLGSKILARQLM